MNKCFLEAINPTITDETSDYSFALLHLAWFIHKNNEGQKIRKLIWGMVEYFPSDCESEIDYLSKEEQKITKTKEAYFYYIRKKITINESAELYERVKTEQRILMFWDKKEEYIYIGEKETKNNVIEEPEGPKSFLATQNSTNEGNYLPFIANNWDCVRVKAFFPNSNDYIKKIISYEKVISSYETELKWKLNEYDEIIGSFWFILPNPIYKSKDIFLDDVNKKIILHIDTRKGKDAKKLDICTAEKRDIGFQLLECKEIDNTNTFEINLNSDIYKLGLYIKCPIRGLLAYYPYSGFIRSISLNMKIKTAEIAIHEKGKNSQENFYSNDFYEYENTIIGEKKANEKQDTPFPIKFHHWPKQIATDYKNQYLFGQNNGGPEEAKKFIRKLINNAEKEVTVIDPYFSDNEIILYSTAIQHKGVKYTVVTSKKHIENYFNKKVNSILQRIIGFISKFLIRKANIKQIPLEFIFSKEYKEFKDKLKIKDLDILLMTGDHPIFHDRFIIIDNTIWITGNSLHSIGNRISMLIKLDNTNNILDEIKSLLNPANNDRIKTFEEIYGVKC